MWPPLCSALDELHGANRAKEKDGGDHQSVDGQPAEGENGVGHLSWRSSTDCTSNHDLNYLRFLIHCI